MLAADARLRATGLYAHVVTSGFHTERGEHAGGTLAAFPRYRLKRSLGGAHLCFSRRTYEALVRPHLNSTQWDRRLSAQAMARSHAFFQRVEDGTTVPEDVVDVDRLSDEEVRRLAAARPPVADGGVALAATRPSVVQHIGAHGMHSGGEDDRFDVAADW